MANYTFQQLESLWTQAGGSAEWAPTMAAVALAESGGDAAAANPSGATGLWQVLSSAQTAAFNAQHPADTMNNPAANAKAAVALLGNGSGISNWEADAVGSYVVQSGGQPLTSAEAQQMATSSAGTGSGGTTTNSNTDPTALASLGASGALPAANGTSGSATLPDVTMSAPIAGADVKNFHGYDLSGIPANMLGNAERAIQEYISDPGYAAKINQTISEDFGYSGSWIQKIPEVNGIMIWASADLDPSTAAGQNLFLGAISNTNWWKTTDQNQRAWAEVQSQDPATAKEALTQAEDHVIATANQVGVTLTKAQVQQIGSVYAAQSFTPTGVLGSASGTSQDWLDQAVVDSALNVKNTGSVTGGNGTTVNEDYANGTTDLSATTNPTQLNGIAQQLYSAFQGVAQNYLLYDPDNPTASLLTTQDLMKQVDTALQGYTGTGSSGLASEFVSNATAQFTQQAMAQAKSVYPTLSTVIDQGTTPSTYITPITNYVSNALGMGQGQVNVMDPQWNWLISTPGANGVKGPVTQDQALQKITSPTFSWTDPNGQKMTYDNTNAAMQTAQNVTQSLGQMFGVGGGGA